MFKTLTPMGNLQYPNQVSCIRFHSLIWDKTHVNISGTTVYMYYYKYEYVHQTEDMYNNVYICCS